ncbi:MAG: NAD(P)-dependent alcohol dehydrogenase [Saprospiraceae bacterium]|nr:NAD(P)-dependent alcohol dehydrogenase [Saprospiraceae bacterium]MDZ4703918.1 NAD(P)-dependent alcohol dehydrogenase [Saprospiraceae bacterium]
MTSKMKAAVCTQYGAPEVIQITELAKPEPKENEIRVKIHATAVNSADCRLRKADPFAVRFFFGLFKPKNPVLGGVLSGIIEAVGKNVTQFQVGDAVFGSTQMHLSTHAEYICLPETGALAIKPENIHHEEAAALPFGGMTALHFFRKANVQPGQKVLIYGASGAVGTAAVQIAKYFGAEVTGVCSTSNLSLVKSLGADTVIDYTKTDFTKTGEVYDVVYETVDKAPFSSCISVLKQDGTLILGAALLGGMLRGLWTSWTSRKKVIIGVASETAEAANFLQKLAAEGKLKAVIDKTYPLEQIAAAHAYADKGHKRGNVVIGLV